MSGRRLLLLTGAGGFVGRAVALRVIGEGWMLRACYHRPVAGQVLLGDSVTATQLGPATDWTAVVTGVDVIVHCAARVHVMRETELDPLTEFRRVNAAGSINLARHAAAAGVRRFVFLSSIGVNGVETTGAPFREDDSPAPHSPYAMSKYEAELGLCEVARQTDMEVVIVRPPLVYGPGAPGNFDRLLHVLDRGLPLPFGAVHNRRSLIALSNLVGFVSTAVSHPQAANRTFLVSDGEDVSTTELLRRVGHALGKPVRLFPVPVSLLRGAARFLGKEDLATQLCGSLQLDIAPAREILGWVPPVRLDDALNEAARHFVVRKLRSA